MRKSVNLFFFSMIVLVFGVGGYSGVASAEKATVLLALERTKPSGGKWDMGRGADPVVCVDNKGCYQSRGRTRDAKLFRNKTIFFPGVRAAGCRNSLVCVFRNVEIPETGADIIPVDLDGLQHDKMTRNFARVDRSCKLRRGNVVCEQGLFAPEYSLWILPEALADAAGPKALEIALYKGMEDYKNEFMADYLRHNRKALGEQVAKFYSAILGDEVPPYCVDYPDVISDAYGLVGHSGSKRYAYRSRRAAEVLDGFIQTRRVAPTLKLLKGQPKLFWALHERIEKFNKFASVSVVQTSPTIDGVRFISNGHGRHSLLIGKTVKARAGAVLHSCLQSKGSLSLFGK